MPDPHLVFSAFSRLHLQSVSVPLPFRPTILRSLHAQQSTPQNAAFYSHALTHSFFTLLHHDFYQPSYSAMCCALFGENTWVWSLAVAARDTKSPSTICLLDDGEMATPVPRAGCVSFCHAPILAQIRAQGLNRAWRSVCTTLCAPRRKSKG
jgi:hypothetical protein